MAVLYAQYESQGCSLVREDREGKDLGAMPMKDGDIVQRLRLTPQGTALAAFATGVIEIDRSGKVIWEFRPAQAWEHAGDARRLPGGNTLIAATVKGRYFVMEVDPRRRVLRQIEVDLKGLIYPEAKQIRSAWALDKNRLLVAGSQGFREFDWKGRKLFEFAADKAGLCYDVVPLEGGNFLFAGSPPGSGKNRVVAEFTRQGKQLWSFPHTCPAHLQLMASGNVLIAAG